MLRITTTDIALDIRTRAAQVSISQPKADMEITRKAPKVIVDSEPIQIRIDQSQCFNESGLKDYAALSRESANMGRQAVFEGIARRSSEGSLLSDIARGGNAIAQIAASNSYRMHEFGIVTMPASRPVIDFVGGTMDIRVEEGFIDLRSSPNKPVIEVEPGSVDISVSQYPDIQVQFIGNEVDIKL